MAVVPRLAIIGGGIGGVAAAVALRQAGFGVVVYEKSVVLREVGAGMMLWPNATRVLHELGVLARVMERSGPNTHFLVRDRKGKILMKLALGAFEVPALCTRRSDLLAALLEALPPDSIRLGHAFEGLEQVGDKVRLQFHDGAVAEYDAVIGADGLRSRVRDDLFGETAPIYRGYQVWRGLAHYDGAAIPPGWNSETWGPGQRFGVLHTGHRQYTWYATANLPANRHYASGIHKGELLRLFAGWHEPIGALLEAAEESAIVKHGAYDHATMRRWSVGRVTLLGDAAHSCTPNLGQGGCMALEDALMLAKCARREPDLPAAFRRYEKLRRERTQPIQQRSRLIGRIGQWEHPLFVVGRHVVTRLIPPQIVERNLRRVYAYTT